MQPIKVVWNRKNRTAGPQSTGRLVRDMISARIGRDSGGTLNFTFPFLRFMDQAASEVGAIDSWRRCLERDSEVPCTLYVHIPFCPQHCKFCAFATTYGSSYDRVLAYLDALDREISAWARHISLQRLSIHSVFIGGGTPNYLRPAEFARLCERLKSEFALSQDTEWTVELYPREDLVECLLPVLRDHGVTRISHCAQDFNDSVLHAAGRQYSGKEARMLGELIQGAGFDMNIDLMIGMPPQSMDNAAANFRAIDSLAPAHVTLNPFSTRAPGIPWAKPGNTTRLQSQEQIRAQYDCYRSRLLSRRYTQVTKCNFERRGSSPFIYESLVRRSMPRFGLGLGALSFTGDISYRNAGTLAGYQERVDAGGFAIEHSYQLVDGDRVRSRLFYGVLSGRVSHLTAIDCEAADIVSVLNALEEHSLIQQDASGFSLTDLGMWHVGLVQRAFLPPWVLEQYRATPEGPERRPES